MLSLNSLKGGLGGLGNRIADAFGTSEKKEKVRFEVKVEDHAPGPYNSNRSFKSAVDFAAKDILEKIPERPKQSWNPFKKLTGDHSAKLVVEVDKAKAAETAQTLSIFVKNLQKVADGWDTSESFSSKNNKHVLGVTLKVEQKTNALRQANNDFDTNVSVITYPDGILPETSRFGAFHRNNRAEVNLQAHDVKSAKEVFNKAAVMMNALGNVTREAFPANAAVPAKFQKKQDDEEIVSKEVVTETREEKVDDKKEIVNTDRKVKLVFEDVDPKIKDEKKSEKNDDTGSGVSELDYL